MANHESAIRQMRTSRRKALRNAPYRSLLKSTVKRTLAAVEEKDKKKAAEMLASAAKTIAKIASKGVIHKRAAARKISGLAKKVHQLSAAV